MRDVCAITCIGFLEFINGCGIERGEFVCIDIERDTAQEHGAVLEQDEVRGILEIILHVICILDDCIRDNDAEDKEEKERDGKNAKEQPEDKDAAQDTEYNDECDDHDKECDDADDDPVHTLAHEPYYLKVFNF